MHDLDFLPVEYRQRNARRRMQIWRHAVAIAACFAVALSALYQQHARRTVLAQLAAVSPPYDLARKQTDRLNELQAQLKNAQADAELVAYLRHPWPRTQLLAELLRPLPDAITFTAVEIGRQQRAAGPAAGQILPTEKGAEDSANTKPPSVQDLKKLHDESDRVKIIVTLEGVTTDTDALHRYLGQLSNGTLFADSELESLDVVNANELAKVLHFVATLQVEPPYGLPGGPAGPPASALVNSDLAQQPAMSIQQSQSAGARPK